MKLTNLSICGKEKHYVKEDVLGMIPLPNPTRSYVPIAHNDLLSRIKAQLGCLGMNIVQEVHSIARGGNRYFGLMQVAPQEIVSDEMGFIVGVRNSYDKSINAAIACGGQVFVCDNLMFNGEVVLGRRHTTFLLRDIDNLIQVAIHKVMSQWKGQVNRFDAYKRHSVTDAVAHDLICQSYNLHAVSQKQVAKVIEEWHHPRHAEFSDRNLYAVHNAFTEVWKENTPDLVFEYCAALHPLLDSVCGLDGVV